MDRTHLYRKYFTLAERRALAATPEDDLTGEVNLLRILLLRFLSAGAGAPPADFKSHLETLRVTSGSAAMIASLLRTQVRALGPGTALDRAIDEALATLDFYLDPDGEEPDAS